MTKSNKKLLIAQLRDASLYWILIPAAIIGSGLLADHLLHLPPLPEIPLLLIATALGLGLLLIFLSTRELTVTGQGTPNPGRPPKKLVQEGVYRLCRHPMFFGYDLTALGVILSFASSGMLCLSFPLFLFAQVRFLKKEEELLAKKFRNSYHAYRQSTSFLLPFLY